MDPVSAFGLAGTVLQFVDSGAKFASLAWDIYRNKTDGRSARSELVSLTSSFEMVLKSLEFSTFSAPGGSKTQPGGIIELARECRTVANDLLVLLRKVTIPAKPSVQDALKIAFQSMWKESEIGVLNKKLNGFRDQLTVNLLVSLRQYASETWQKQEEMRETLGVINDKGEKFEGIANSILTYITSKSPRSDVTKFQLTLRLSDEISRSYTQPASDAPTAAELLRLSPEGVHDVQSLILQSLWYYGMEDREEGISETYESTFQWIFREIGSDKAKWHNFMEWLEGKDQMYWITGKAGSGKSTLMKFLCRPTEQDPEPESLGNDPARKPRCHRQLLSWASEKRLVVVSYYFWNAGSQIQADQTGLLRSLLYQILQQSPGLAAAAVPSHWESAAMFKVFPADWTEAELRSALEVAVRKSTASCRICFFIDGLDEFAGAHEALVSFIKRLAGIGSGDVKFCVSSRPWVIFGDAFETKPQLRLEDLTHDDISHFVISKLTLDAEFHKLHQREPKYAEKLISNIVSKASGVFLWVRLVVWSLLAGMKNGDRIRDLQQRLDCLPPELENLYDRLLQALDPTYLEHAAQMIMLMESSMGPLNLLLFLYADDEDAESITSKRPGESLTEEALSSRLEAMERRLNSRWKGLIELNRAQKADTVEDRANRTVQYIHMTVQDFVRSRKMQASLVSYLKSPYDPDLCLCIAHWAHLKLSATRVRPGFVRFAIGLCLDHAARALPSSQHAICEVLDDMSNALPVISQRIGDPHYRLDLLPGRYLGIHWGYNANDCEFGETFMSLVVKHGVTAYVRERVRPGCLVQRVDAGGTPYEWPLLRDAIYCSPPNEKMIECLRSLGADAKCEIILPKPFLEAPGFKVFLPSKLKWWKLRHSVAADGLPLSLPETEYGEGSSPTTDSRKLRFKRWLKGK